jgi:hypothetical protein
MQILDQEDVKPHKVRYYLERRDPDFAEKMAEVLCVYRKVKFLKKAAAASRQKPSDAVAVISYDEKPGIEAIATTAPDLPPVPGMHATFAREHEYKPRRRELGSPISLPAASSSPSRPSTGHGSTSSRAFFPSWPAQTCATSASHPSKNLRTASWPPWISSTGTPWFTPGPINSTRPPGMIRTSKSMI